MALLMPLATGTVGLLLFALGNAGFAAGVVVLSILTRTHRHQVGDVVHLQRRVADPVVGGQPALQPDPHLMAVRRLLHQHVCRERRLPGRDQPQMQIVYLDHVLRAGQRTGHPGRVEPGGRGLQQDAA